MCVYVFHWNIQFRIFQWEKREWMKEEKRENLFFLPLIISSHSFWIVEWISWMDDTINDYDGGRSLLPSNRYSIHVCIERPVVEHPPNNRDIRKNLYTSRYYNSLSFNGILELVTLCIIWSVAKYCYNLFSFFSLFAKHESFVETLPVSLWGRV
jgi:hypothetical protein